MCVCGGGQGGRGLNNPFACVSGEFKSGRF